jgi:antitoxin HicB
VFDYALDLTPDDDTWLITSPDFPELTTFARLGDVVDAAARGRDALVAVLAHRMDSGEPIPDPSPARNRLVVRLPTLVGLKVTLYREMQAQRIAVSELARRIERDPKEVRRLLDVTHGSRTDLLDPRACGD